MIQIIPNTFEELLELIKKYAPNTNLTDEDFDGYYERIRRERNLIPLFLMFGNHNIFNLYKDIGIVRDELDIINTLDKQDLPVNMANISAVVLDALAQKDHRLDDDDYTILRI